MNALVLFFGVLLVAGVEPSKTSDEDLKAYQDAKSQAKRNPAAHVRLALWCESHGLEAERLKHLAIAVLADPQNATARGLMGLVSYHGQWKKPADVATKVRDDAALGATLAEYNAKREKSANTADAQWRLALWCEENGLKAESRAHLAAVTHLDPTRDAAWKRLGCKKHSGRWMSEEQIAAEKAGVEAQKKADHYWKATLEKWRDWLGKKERRAEAERQLASVADPRAVPMVCAVFGAGDRASQTRAVQLLGQIDSPAASRALASLAVFGASAELRRKAKETLRHRDAREFADLLIGLLREKIEYEVKPVGGPGSPGQIFIKGKLVNLLRKYDPATVNPALTQIRPGDVVGFDPQGRPVIIRQGFYEANIGGAGSHPELPIVPNWGPFGMVSHRSAGGGVGPLDLGWPFWSRPMPPPGSAASLLANYWQPSPAGFGSWDNGASSYSPSSFFSFLPFSAGAAGGRPSAPGYGALGANSAYLAFRTDTQIDLALATEGGTAVAQKQLQSDTKSIDDFNKGIQELNTQVADILQDVVGVDLGADREAWKKWWVDQLGYAYQPQKYDNPTILENVPIGVATATTPLFAFQRMSCFGAGTLVRTITGSQPIETLAVGDQVLTQDTKTGALSYQPILVIHHNPPSKTFRITLGDEPVISSEFHRFWKAGRGWVMARDLKVGDTIRTLDGLAKVTEFETDVVQPVFNLDIAETGSFFVGQQGALVHDNTLPAPVHQPFDAEPELAAARPLN